ncbi:alpha-L-rhamnosidase [Algibacillus agarilyticus]|uniref:alpha-L-rhamnosidase n=1 Tax=Algibacillus agarilyticus TaxID=2234133 RepID=UPI001E5F23EE|nr:alpha-L-rhamnosidase [Algibacillus agarilyticus]
MNEIHKNFFITLFILLFVASCSLQNSVDFSNNTDKTSQLKRAGQDPQHLTIKDAAISLKVGEGFINPLGYYEREPRFSWRLSDKSNDYFQTAYQIQVASSLALLKSNPDLWYTPKVYSADTAWINYQGQPLSSRQVIYWRVRYWDENDQVSKWSKAATVELGLLNNADWQAQWIRHPDVDETADYKRGSRVITNKLYRPQYLRKTFTTKAKVKQARLYITAKGVFESYINGHKVSNDVMTPGWTPYLQRIETLTYDVTKLLITEESNTEENNTKEKNTSENVIAATVAEGWHTGRILSPQVRDVKPSALLAQLEIDYTDGTKQTIVTDDSWQASIKGPIRLAGNYDGETYDANYEMPGWNTASFNSNEWLPVITDALEPQVALAPKRHTAPTTKLVLHAQKIVNVANPQPGVVVFDMGQNMLGVPQINIPVIANQKVTIRFAEALQHNTFYTKNYRSALSTDHYIPAQTGRISYKPTFTFHGYRYVEISGFDQHKKPELTWLTGLVQHSDFKITDSFESSHEKLNKLSKNIVWGLRGNFLDIPTDCPQRDERLGWTGDAQVFAAPSMYMADVYGFWAAWLQTVREEQASNGRIPNFVPTKQNKHTKGASSGWGDVAVIVPWELYLLTGDKQILAENYSMIKGWMNYHQSQSNHSISNMNSFRDWLQPYPQSDNKSQARRGDTPQKLISTAYYARALDYAAKVANVLGYQADAQHYSHVLNQVKKAFRLHFYDANTRVKSSNTQTSYLLPLAFNLFEGTDIKNAQQHLISTIEQAGHHLGTGFLGTPLLAPVLQDMGRSDLMYQLLFKETYPSWFYSINNGATTTWERWDSYSLEKGFSKESMNSLNHYAYGAVAEWFYEGILGIKSTQPGFKRFKVAPQFNARLNKAKGDYTTPNGVISVDWQIEAEQLLMTVQIPKNTTANMVLPQVNTETLTLNGKPVIAAAQLVNLPPGQYVLTGRVNL